MIREKELHLVCKNYTLKGVQKPVKENPYKVAGVILRVNYHVTACVWRNEHVVRNGADREAKPFI